MFSDQGMAIPHTCNVLADSVRSVDARLVTRDLFESYQAENEPVVLLGTFSGLQIAVPLTFLES